MVPGFAQDDLLLEVVMLLASMALDPEVPSLIVNSRIPQMLQDTMQAKAGDDVSSCRVI